MTHAARFLSEEAERPPELRILDSMIEAATRNLLGSRQEDGHWRFELECDITTTAQYALLFHFLGRGDDSRVAACCARLRSQQLPTGGWALYPGGRVEPSISTLAYLCLKLAGDDPSAPAMAAARRAILRAGGLNACNSYVKLVLSTFGLWSWWRAPPIPPEILLQPRWSWFSIYEMSCWTRSMIVPLAVIWAVRPRVPLGVTIDELKGGARPVRARRPLRAVLWSAAFTGFGGLVRLGERLGLFRPWRRHSLAKVERWLDKRMEAADGQGGIFPGMLWTVMALWSLGYREDDPRVQEQFRHLERHEIEEGGEMRVQPGIGPVWDTGLTVNALLTAGVGDREASIQEALRWLLDREIRVAGDWRYKSLQDAPGCWCFGYRNDLHPDCDDTAEVLRALLRIRGGNEALEARRRGAVERGVRWLLGMQNRDGGWAAFDRGCNREILTFLPFADHNAIIDPSTPDITARCLSTLIGAGVEPSEAPVRRAAEYLLQQQEEEETWPGRWGCNHIYGTSLVLCALTDLASAAPGAWSQRVAGACKGGRRWLLRVQNPDGGWGESAATYAGLGDKGDGPSTPSQTAWAMQGLIATAAAAPRRGDDEATAALGRAAAFLMERQREDGAWQDDWMTGVGFPRTIYLRYHGYARHFPLAALAALRRLGK